MKVISFCGWEWFGSKERSSMETKMTALDRMLIGGLVVLAALLWLFRWLPVSATGLMARIELEGRVVNEVALQKGIARTVTIQLPHGMAYLEVKDRAVRLRELPRKLCPNKVCSHMGWIRKPGELIICVPNRLAIRLVSPNSPKPAVDAIAR